MAAFEEGIALLQASSNTEITNVTSQAPLEGYDDNVTVLGILKAVVLLIATCSIVVGHGLVFASYWRNKKMRTPMNFYILQLSIADVLVGLIFIPLEIIGIFELKWFENLPLCLTYIGTAFLSLAASVIALNAMFLDRLFSIVRPLTYVNEMSSRQYVRSVVGVWFIPVTACLVLPMFWHNGVVVIPGSTPCMVIYTMKRTYYKAFLLPLAYSLAFTVAGLNIPIFYIAHKQSQVLRNQVVAFDGSKGRQFKDGKTRLKLERKIAKTAFLVFGILYTCWMPYVIALTHKVIDDESYENPMSTDYEIARMLSSLVLINSAVNPIIYAVKLKQYRREFMHILKPLMPCKVSVSPASNENILSISN